MEDPEIQALFPTYMAGQADASARAARNSCGMVEIAKGEPENFLTEAELRAKFHGLADAVLGARPRRAAGRCGARTRPARRTSTA